MGPTWGPAGYCQPQVGPMLAPWTLLSGYLGLLEVVSSFLTTSSFGIPPTQAQVECQMGQIRIPSWSITYSLWLIQWGADLGSNNCLHFCSTDSAGAYFTWFPHQVSVQQKLDFHCNWNFDHKIATDICTYHDNRGAMAYAKFCCDCFIRLCVITKQHFCWNGLLSEKNISEMGFWYKLIWHRLDLIDRFCLIYYMCITLCLCL